ncbi:MAG: MazG nucleotide pyrophosphohydrolase domain-containing protein [Peptococcaceae bacterium]|nr:MazG nucleotide pyrophosphohydrolase domain-containing protein [Peptococcaceae bacterium]
METTYDIMPLVDVIRRLRAPDGYPWDRVQTMASMRKHLLEEAYEVCDAVDRGDMVNLQEELGDVLFHVIFYSEMAAEAGNFDLQTVIDGVCEKMQRRHPVLYPPAGGEPVENDWERIKAQEKRARHQPSRLPENLPALMKLDKLVGKLEKNHSHEEILARFGTDEKSRALLELVIRNRASESVTELVCANLAKSIEDFINA